MTKQKISRLPIMASGLWRRPASNRQPPPCKGGALPIELRPRMSWACNITANRTTEMGVPRFELGTSSLSAMRSNQLSYTPDKLTSRTNEKLSIVENAIFVSKGLNRYAKSRFFRTQYLFHQSSRSCGNAITCGNGCLDCRKNRTFSLIGFPIAVIMQGL